MNRTALACLATTLVLAGVLLTCCKDEPADEPRLLVLDGIEFRRDEVAPYVAFFDQFLPEVGPKTKVMRVLEEHLIPLKLAQRAFPKERAEQKAHAEALSSVATNVEELERQSALIEHKSNRSLNRTSASLPVAMFLFDPANGPGSVSPPLEVPHGWLVVAARDLKESPGLALDDYVEALQVGFLTHKSADFFAWFDQQKQALRGKATFVHPEYQSALPAWIGPPTPQ